MPWAGGADLGGREARCITREPLQSVRVQAIDQSAEQFDTWCVEWVLRHLGGGCWQEMASDYYG